MNKMETRKQVLKEELQTMKKALMVEMKKMLKEELVVEIKKELVVEKENLLKIVEEIKHLKTDLDNTIQFMNSKFEMVLNQNKDLSDKVSKLVDEKKVMESQLKSIKEEKNGLSSQVDFLERNLKGKNLEISGVPFTKNEKVIDLAVKVVTNIDSKIKEGDIEYARRLMKKDRNGATKYGPILVRFKNIDQRNYLFKNKKYLAQAKLQDVINGDEKVFINENLTPQNKKVFYHANCFKKQHNWRYVWTSNGIVFLRKTENSDAVTIRNIVDLEKLV